MRTILAAIYLVSALSIASLAHARPLTEQETTTLRSRSVNTQSEFEARVLARRMGQELNMDAVQPLLDAKDISDLKVFVTALGEGRELADIDYDSLSQQVLLHPMPPVYRSAVEAIFRQEKAEARSAKEYTQDSLRRWILFNRVDIVTSYLEHGVDPNGRDSNGFPPLVGSLNPARPAIAKLLIDRGADVNLAGGPFRIAPLHLACQGYPPGNARAAAEMVTLLLSHGAAVNVTDALGRAPVHNAASSGNTECLARLIAAGGDVNLKTSGKKDLNTKDARTLLYAGATPLHFAADAGHVESAVFLLGHGANVNATTDSGMTPLFAAVANHPSAATVTLLIDNGADVNLSVDGISPRLIAHGRNDAKIEKLLKAKGATYNPLMLAKLKAQTWMMGNGH